MRWPRPPRQSAPTDVPLVVDSERWPPSVRQRARV